MPHPLANAPLDRLRWADDAELTAALARRARVSSRLELEEEALRAADLQRQISNAGPAVLDLPGGGFAGLLLVRRRRALLLAPDLSVGAVSLDDLCEALCAAAAAPHVAAVDALLDRCAAPPRRRKRARRILLRERLHGETVGRARQLRVDTGSSFLRQARAAGLARPLATLIGAHVAEYGLWLASWVLAGRSILSGRLDPGLMLGWALLLLTVVPFRMLAVWSEGRLAIGAGGLLKQRLLAGALRLDPDRMRREGAGQLLGRVIESETVETAGVSGGLAGLVALVELALSAWVLWVGAGGAPALALLGLWVAIGTLLAWRFSCARSRWTGARLALTHDMVERMSGHRTRLAQQPPENWHDGEDPALDGYLAQSAVMDRLSVRLTALLPRGWLLAGLASLLPAFFSGAPAESLAIGVGGVLFAHGALRRLAGGLGQLAGVVISWRQIAPLFHAATAIPRSETTRADDIAAAKAVVEAGSLSFRHRPAGRAVFEGLDLKIARGDRVLLEGESGGGKSTLVSLLAGLREPSSGVLLSGGMDRASIGEKNWRRRVAVAPQYHENHVLTGSLLFNVLMSRPWPPSQEDVEEAERVCRELGLGPLLERMPAGVMEMVGETGWQLSQGERSRLFLARALLQRSELVVLDESFAALDPESLQKSLECALRRAPTLMVVAHP